MMDDLNDEEKSDLEIIFQDIEPLRKKTVVRSVGSGLGKFFSILFNPGNAFQKTLDKDYNQPAYENLFSFGQWRSNKAAGGFFYFHLVFSYIICEIFIYNLTDRPPRGVAPQHSPLIPYIKPLVCLTYISILIFSKELHKSLDALKYFLLSIVAVIAAYFFYPLGFAFAAYLTTQHFGYNPFKKEEEDEDDMLKNISRESRLSNPKFADLERAYHNKHANIKTFSQAEIEATDDEMTRLDKHILNLEFGRMEKNRQKDVDLFNKLSKFDDVSEYYVPEREGELIKSQKTKEDIKKDAVQTELNSPSTVKGSKVVTKPSSDSSGIRKTVKNLSTQFFHGVGVKGGDPKVIRGHTVLGSKKENDDDPM